MKNLKILAAIMLSVAMLFALCACDGDAANNDGEGGQQAAADPMEAVAATYGIDLKSEEIQNMSADRTENAKLSALIHDYFQDFTFFSDSELENTTYDDIKEQLGVDATTYNYEAGYERNVFTWVGESDIVKFSAWFENGKLYAIGSANVE